VGQRRFTVEVDQTLCIGCGLCEDNAPNVFRVNGFTAQPQRSEVTDSELGNVLLAAQECPFGAIAMELSGSATGDHDQEGGDEEERGEISQYHRKHRNTGDGNHIKAEDAERLQRVEYHLTIVRDGADHDQHPGTVSGA
jgi:ferredoxin